MRILVFSQFYREPGMTGPARMDELAHLWADAGCEVTTVAGTVDHATGAALRRPVERARAGVRVERAWTLPASKTSSIGRIARDASYAATASLRMLARLPKPDVVVASSPPLFTGIPGVLAAKRYRVPLVFEMRDMWPDIAVEFGALRGPPARAAYALERWILRSATKCVVVTPAFVPRLARKGVPADKVAVIPNGVLPDQFAPGPPDSALRASLGWEERFVVLYAGVHGPAQALDQVLRAADVLRDDREILFSLVGAGSDKPRLEALARELALPNVQFLPPVPREAMPALLRSADVALSTLKRVPGFAEVYPAKIFEIMATARPLVLAGEGAAAELVERAGGGVVVPPEAPKELARAVLEAKGDPAAARATGERGARFVRASFDRRKLAADYLALLRELSA